MGAIQSFSRPLTQRGGLGLRQEPAGFEFKFEQFAPAGPITDEGSELFGLHDHLCRFAPPADAEHQQGPFRDQAGRIDQTIALGLGIHQQDAPAPRGQNLDIDQINNEHTPLRRQQGQ